MSPKGPLDPQNGVLPSLVVRYSDGQTTLIQTKKLTGQRMKDTWETLPPRSSCHWVNVVLLGVGSSLETGQHKHTV